MLILGQHDRMSLQIARWRRALERIPHDIYHTPEYHSLPGFGQSGVPQAFIHEEGGEVFLWPYLLTPIPGSDGCNDVTSVYGYPGPVASTEDPAFIAAAWQALSAHWQAQDVVSAFTRFHPILANHTLLEALPEARAGIRAYGGTVSIDLSLPEEIQIRRYNKKLRQEVRKLREAGLSSIEDTRWTHADTFIGIYDDTMARLGSRPEYLVDRAWVDGLRDAVGSNARLFVTRARNQAVAAAMIILTHRPFVHCHLIGIATQFADDSPSKLLLDDVRAWGRENGYRAMHLGGGLGGREDALLQFKRRFSPVLHPFRTGNWILDAVRYRELAEQHSARLVAEGASLTGVTFFPAYRYVPHDPAVCRP